jgi:hypothetical protein
MSRFAVASKEELEAAPPGYLRALKSRGVDVRASTNGVHVKQGGSYLFDPSKRTNRKAIQRRTVDYFGTVMLWNEHRWEEEILKDYRPMQPDGDFVVNVRLPIRHLLG